MKIAFCINDLGQVHTFRHLINNLINKKHQVEILARDHGTTLELLDKYGLEYSSFKSIGSKSTRIFEMLIHLWEGLKLSRRFTPDIFIGFGVDAAVISALLRKPCIVFNDSEPIPVQHFLIRLFASVIFTPACFGKDLGKKHIRFAGYKELAYLHPDYFTPEPSIYDELGINRDEKYIILRFNAFDALHDFNRRGFSLSDKYQLVKELKKYARIFISSERGLPPDLAGYKLPIPVHRIHHALYYAQLLVADTGTMVWEAAVLGTPAVACGSFISQFGNFIELEQKYGLLYSFREAEPAIEKSLELIQQPDVKQEWAEKRQRLLADKIDVTQFMVELVENYPQTRLHRIEPAVEK